MKKVNPEIILASLSPFGQSGPYKEFIGTDITLTALSGLDFLGFGLPPGSASLGEMVNQGRNNLQAPWLGLTSFFTLGLMLGLLVFIGEAVRDALDPRKTFN